MTDPSTTPLTSNPQSGPAVARITAASEMGVYVTPSHLLEYFYCPRFTYFEHGLGLPEYQERRYKVIKGREVHEKQHRINPRYLRKKLGVVRREHNVELASDRLSLKGIVDEVLWLEDGTMAPLDYKFAEFKGRVFKNLAVQSALYGMLIEEGHGAGCPRGFLCFTRSNRKVVEVALTPELKREAREAIEEVLRIIQTGFFPPATRYKARCPDCCYRRVCVR